MFLRRLLIAFTATWMAPSLVLGASTYEAEQKRSEPVLKLRGILRPFVDTCARKKDARSKRICISVNERLRSQYQTKVYRVTRKASAAGPLVVSYQKRPRPHMVITVKGCLTCEAPMLARKGGNIANARFFVFKMPDNIKIRRGRRRGSPYSLEDIDVASYKVDLPPKMTAKKFNKEVKPFLRLDLVFRPVDGVTMVGRRFKYGVINFELVAHRVYDRCTGKVFGATPAMKGEIPPDNEDPICPHNQRRNIVKPKLPATLPQKVVKQLMETVGSDLQACYEQFGTAGKLPTVVTVASTGKVKDVAVGGDLKDTPAARCVQRLIRNITFPRFSGNDARITWPFQLSQ